MPLRAKILNPAMAGSATRSLSTSTPQIRELPGDEPNDVLFNSQYGVRTITLNRPKKLNSLNGSMARKIIPRLQEWEKSQLANVVVIKGEGRAFCAGGDVTALAQDNQKGTEGQQASKDYFGLEYQLDHQIATYSKPYVAFIDGITMGGGVGLSVHAPFRIATENTVFAMPETTIGFFPDVGASFFLPRMDGELGMYLALTSEQLKGVNVFYAGIATHYLHSTSLPSLESRLSEIQFKDSLNLQSRLQIINSTIEEFATGLPHDQPIAAPVGGQIRAAVDYVFQPANNFDDIITALEGLEQTQSDIEEIRSWAKRTRETILQRSPTSARVTLRQLREGGKWSIAETFRREHLIASRFMEHADFVEGVSSLLIRKPKTTPKWSPASSAEVSEQDVDGFFDGTPGLQLMGTGDYLDYPHAWVGLPREGEVEAYVSKKGGLTKDAVVSHFEEANGGKQETREKIEEILARKTTEGGDGSVTWKSIYLLINLLPTRETTESSDTAMVLRPTYDNTCLTLTSQNTPDPFIVFAQGNIYLTFTANTRIPLWEAISIFSFLKDSDSALVTKGPLFIPQPGTPWSERLWAPELHDLEGRWWVYFAAADPVLGNRSHRLYVLRGPPSSGSPRGEGPEDWTFVGAVKGMDQSQWAIDGTVFTLNGQLYLAYSGWPVSSPPDDEKTQALYLLPLSSPTEAIAGATAAQISLPSEPWEKTGDVAIQEGPQWIAAPHLTPSGEPEWQGLLYSCSASWTAHYKMATLQYLGGHPMAASSWRKSRKPLLQSDANGAGPYGPGHGMFLQEGGETLAVFHATDRVGDGNQGRKARMQRVIWDERGPWMGGWVGRETSSKEDWVRGAASAESVTIIAEAES
nr:hypothetical protein B0A51_14634 [Rachicladosporium sp. CCFEE 5018]